MLFLFYQYNLQESNNDLKDAFENVDVVIHLAAKVHDLSSKQSLDEYIKINVEGTQRLLEKAIGNNVKRFIYLSSIKVHGENNSYEIKNGISESSILEPEDPYSISKLQCEKTHCFIVPET